LVPAVIINLIRRDERKGLEREEWERKGVKRSSLF
jgi:hypothetical protein